MRRVVHVGLPKTGTTTLQRHVFKKLAHLRGLTYWRARDLNELLEAHAKQQEPPRLECSEEDLFVSVETLSGAAANWESNAERNLKYFGPETTILITLRKPSGWFRSAFQQHSHQLCEFAEPSEYFRMEPPDPETAPRIWMDVSGFDQARYVKAYADRFDNVVVEKYERLKDFALIDHVYRLTEEEREILAQEFQLRSSNRSFSQSAVRLSTALLNAKKRLGLRTRREPMQKTLGQRAWRFLIQYIYDRIVPYEAYRIDWETTSIDVEAFDQAYHELPGFSVWKNGSRVYFEP